MQHPNYFESSLSVELFGKSENLVLSKHLNLTAFKVKCTTELKKYTLFNHSFNISIWTRNKKNQKWLSHSILIHDQKLYMHLISDVFFFIYNNSHLFMVQKYSHTALIKKVVWDSLRLIIQPQSFTEYMMYINYIHVQQLLGRMTSQIEGCECCVLLCSSYNDWSKIHER